MVAEVNNKAVGIIFGKNKEKHRCSLGYLFRGVSALTQLLFLKEGRQILYFYRDVGRIDKLLLKKCPQHYKDEVALFALAPEYRGFGIGGQLFHCLTEYMKKEHIPAFFLYTDTSCNFGFYEHQGMVRQQRYRHVSRINEKMLK